MDLIEKSAAGVGEPAVQLRKTLGLLPLVLYGLGVTIGAGIYVLIGETAAKAGYFAPTSFLVAAIVMAFSAASFAEFTGRIPKSAGEAAFVDEGFGIGWLTLLVGLSIVASGVVAAAAIALGCAGYLALLVPLPITILAVMVILAMGLLAAWGIRESVTFAGVLTVLEVGGLIAIIVAGFAASPDLLVSVPKTMPAIQDQSGWLLVMGAGLIAFFAFIGFDDVVNIVEEAKDPSHAMPWAIGITLVVVTIIYYLVCLVALETLPLAELGASKAPVGLLFERLTGLSPLAITLIAVFATLNGVVIQIIMASRVVYGLSRQGKLPNTLGVVHPFTRTPVLATVIITAIIILFAMFVPLAQLAEWTSLIILFVFFLVNVALIRVKQRERAGVRVKPIGTFQVPIIVPILGAISCFGFLAGALFV